MLNACSVRMTSCGPRLEKTVILEKMYEITIELCIRSLTIKGRIPLFLMM